MFRTLYRKSNHTFCIQWLFRKSAFYEMVWKTLLEPDRPQMAMSYGACAWRAGYTGRFIMFSVITNTYNKKTKGPTLMELFTVRGKLEKFFFDIWKCSMCAPRVTQHTQSSSCHTRVNTIDACVARTAICVLCHPWCTHRTSLAFFMEQSPSWEANRFCS
jgi:hypothetical protein